MSTAPRRYYEAIVTDPDTGDKHTFTADTEDGLDAAIEAHFGRDDDGDTSD